MNNKAKTVLSSSLLLSRQSDKQKLICADNGKFPWQNRILGNVDQIYFFTSCSSNQ